MMPRKSKTSWTEGTNKEKLIDPNNVGRKLLEKMGWQHGLGLGKDNQGMTENPQWKYRRDANNKFGFKCKEEVQAKEILVHQNAFEDLLHELNTQDSVENVEPACPLEFTFRDPVQLSKRPTRYVKIAEAKNLNNYSVKDLEGIIGKDVTQKNLSSFHEAAKEGKAKVDRTIHIQVCRESRNEKKSQVFQPVVQTRKRKLNASGETKTTSETHPYINDVEERSLPVSEPKKKKECINLLDNCSAQCSAKHSKLGNIESKVKNTRINEGRNFKTPSDTDLYTSLDSIKPKNKVCMDNSSENRVEGILFENEIKKQYLQQESKIQNIGYSDNNYFCLIPKGNTKEGNFCTDSNCTTLEVEMNARPESETREEKSRNSNQDNISNNTLCSKMDTEYSHVSCDSKNMQSIVEVHQNKENLTEGDSQEFCGKVAQDDVLYKIGHGFVGSNLYAIKGYGNW